MAEENKVKVDMIGEIRKHIDKLEPVLDKLVKAPTDTTDVRGIIDMSNYILAMYGHINEIIDPPKRQPGLLDCIRREFEEEPEPELEPEDIN